MQGVEDILHSGFVAVELVRNVGFAVNGTARSQRHHFPLERSPDRLFQTEPHSPDLLDEELAAARGTLVMRQDVDDPAAGNNVSQKGFPA